MVDWQVFAAGTFFLILSVAMFIARVLAAKLLGAEVPRFIPYLVLAISLLLMIHAFGLFEGLWSATIGATNVYELAAGFALLILILSPWAERFDPRFRTVLFIVSLVMIADGVGLINLQAMIKPIEEAAYAIGSWIYFNWMSFALLAGIAVFVWVVVKVLRKYRIKIVREV